LAESDAELSQIYARLAAEGTPLEFSDGCG
jgi:hypothetical protein